MTIVAGVDFGTLSVRVSIIDTMKGRLSSAVADYPLRRMREDPNYAAQAHSDHMRALAIATREAIRAGSVSGSDVQALALDTTGSSVVPVDAAMQPLNDHYLWCDHRARAETQEITALAHQERFEGVEWCGGVYSHEWGFAKLLHWMRHNPEKRNRFASAFEHCDMVAATLCGVTEPKHVKRSVCAMGHKWMWNPRWGGMPPQSFLSKLDPLLDGVGDKLDGEYRTSDRLAGHLSVSWASKLGLSASIPIPVGAFDAHSDALGAGCHEGDVVNVVGTSTCIIAMARHAELTPGVCGVVPGSVHPRYTGIEAGLSATGGIFEAITRRSGIKVVELSRGLEAYRAAQTGLLRLSWDNGDRTVLVSQERGRVTLGWNLLHTAPDELFAAIEGTPFNTRIILEHMADHGIRVDRVINGGGIPQNNPVLNQVYANALGKPVLVPADIPISLGSGIFAALAADAFPTVEAAQSALCLRYSEFNPNPRDLIVYEKLYQLYRKIYFCLGQRSALPVGLGDVLPELREIARKVTVYESI